MKHARMVGGNSSVKDSQSMASRVRLEEKRRQTDVPEKIEEEPASDIQLPDNLSEDD